MDQYISTTPYNHFTVGPDNVFGQPAGTQGYSVGYGAFVLLAPLPPGEHTLHFHGEYPKFGDLVADKTIILTVAK